MQGHEVTFPYTPVKPVSRWQARLWMAWTLSGVLLSALAAFVLVPVRAIVSE